MRLTTFSDYSLRVLMYLGVHADRLATIGEIAAAYGISENHLMKVAHALALRGYLETTRGKGGGVMLARPPHEINVGEIVRAIEGDTSLVECFEPANFDCRIGQVCVLRRVLREAQNAFFGALDRYTLTDLVKPKPRLAKILIKPRRAGVRQTGPAG